VIGDDVAMIGNDLFKVYYEVVAILQGVGISKSKGFHMETQLLDNPLTSGQLNLPHTAELAKRIFCDGNEITIVPPDEVFTSFESPTQMPDLYVSLKKRGYPIPEDHILMPGLSSLCRHKKTALLLLTNPLVRALSLTRDSVDMAPWNTLPWYKPGFSEVKFEQDFIKVLRGQIIAVLLKVITGINQWFMLATKSGSTKVKAWRYDSETQGLVIYLVAEKVTGLLNKAISNKKIAEVFPEGKPVNWKSLKDMLGSFQVSFEIELLFKEQDIHKRVERPHFVNTIILKVIKEILKVEERS
jgi:hypothetical protein